MHQVVENISSAKDVYVAVVNKVILGTAIIASGTDEATEVIGTFSPNWVINNYIFGVNTVQFIQLITGIWIAWCLIKAFRDERRIKNKKKSEPSKKEYPIIASTGGADKPKPR